MFGYVTTNMEEMKDQRLSDLSWILLRSLPGSERRSRTNFQGYSDV